MRRMLVVALVSALIATLAVAPAHAQKKKRKPVTFEASGSFALGHPLTFLADGSITGAEFIATCGVPASQGLDGYVVELSEEISAAPANVILSGSDASDLYDLDMYYFNSGCESVGAQSSADSNEFGVLGAGTKYILVTAFTGVQVSFDLTATEII